MPYLNIPAFIEVIRRLCLAENAASSFDVVLMGVIILYSMTTIVLILEHLLSGCTRGLQLKRTNNLPDKAKYIRSSAARAR